MENVEQTIISQYANSATIVQLVQNMNQYIDQTANFQAFYDYVWNVNTAVGFGLDVWGRIVDVSRNLVVTVDANLLGFKEMGAGATPFGQAPFYAGVPSTSSYILSDAAYRTLILTKALSNITATTAPAINQLLNNLFAGRGRCYVNDMGAMQMRYTFEFYLQPYEVSIVNSSGVLPHGAGVQVSVVQVPQADQLFGFSEMGAGAYPFGQGRFR